MFSWKTFSFRSLTIVALAIALAPRTAFAQSNTAPSEPAAGPPGVTVKWNNGLDVSTTDGANDFQVGGLVQVDGRFTTDDPLHAVTDTFVLRRVRPIFQGRAGKYFVLTLMPDFGNGTTVLFDAYFDTKLSSAVRIRVGKDKTPLGYEQLQSDFAVVFPERTLVTSLVPNREIGIQARGVLAGGHVTLA